ARDEFYHTRDFADGYVSLTDTGADAADKVREIRGVSRAEGRIVKDVKVLIEGEPRNVTLRVVSGLGEGAVNTVALLDGRMPRRDENAALIGQKFYAARGLRAGSVLQIASEGRELALNVAGAGQSPEFVFAIKGGGDMMPDPETFEIAYVSGQLAEQITGMRGKINDIIFTIDGSRDYQDIERDIKRTLRDRGVKNVYARKDQPSNAMLNEEFKQLEASAKSVPLIFMAIAAIILYITLRRLVEQQRGQTGTMKAFGYRRADILKHYMSYGAVTGFAGGILGGIAGIWLSYVFIDMYKVYYSLPNLQGEILWRYFAGGTAASVVFSAAAAYAGARGILSLTPAQAMSAPVPAFGKKSLFEKLPGFAEIFTLQGNMAIRNLVRNYKRSLLVLTGVMFTFALMAAMMSLMAVITDVLMEHFTKVQQYDVKVTLAGSSDQRGAARELAARKGVTRVEAIFEMPAELTRLNYKKDTVIIGIDKGSELYKVYDGGGRQVAVPDEGIVLSSYIAEKLGAKVGGVVVVNSPYARNQDIKITVSGIISQSIGANAYMSGAALNRLAGSAHAATSLMALADQDGVREIKESYKTAANVSLIEARQETIDKYLEIMGSATGTIWIMAVVSIFTVFAVIYTSSMISLDERRREFSLLRLMGMRLGEVMEIISLEQWIVGAAGILLGIPLSFLFNYVIVRSMSGDIYSLPFRMSGGAMLQSALGVTAAIVLANLWIKRRLGKINMIEALSAGTRE
ncbi:MAG: FtsX-like permease family protein, partial [Clostridiales bacterium]|nr:FtsX-like permease family protein [Clostridiales bacterium]